MLTALRRLFSGLTGRSFSDAAAGYAKARGEAMIRREIRDRARGLMDRMGVTVESATEEQRDRIERFAQGHLYPTHPFFAREPLGGS